MNQTFFYGKEVESMQMLKKGNKINWTNNYTDEHGHGTAITSIIFEHFNNVEIINLKILNEKLESNIIDLLEAIKFSINCRVDIINMSLGTIYEKNIDRLYGLCQKAKDNNILMVAAYNNHNKLSYPAEFDNVFGIKHRLLPPNQIFYKDYKKNVIYTNLRSRVSWKNQQINYVKGNSYACAKFTGILSEIISKNNNRDIKFIKKVLMNKSISEQEYKTYKKEHRVEDNDEKLIMYPVDDRTIGFINKDKNDIIGFYDTRTFYKSFVEAKDNTIKINIYNDLEEALRYADTLIIDRCDYIPENIKGKIIEDIAIRAINMKKNVVIRNIYNLKNNEYLNKLSQEKKVRLIISK